jgi:hypothetical protein
VSQGNCKGGMWEQGPAYHPFHESLIEAYQLGSASGCKGQQAAVSHADKVHQSGVITTLPPQLPVPASPSSCSPLSQSRMSHVRVPPLTSGASAAWSPPQHRTQM